MEILDFVKDRHNSLDIESVSLNDIGYNFISESRKAYCRVVLYLPWVSV